MKLQKEMAGLELTFVRGNFLMMKTRIMIVKSRFFFTSFLDSKKNLCLTIILILFGICDEEFSYTL